MTARKACAAAAVKEGRVKVVQAGPERVALCRVEGKVFAIEDRCSHDDGPLGEGELRGFEIVCPRHGARFDVRTGLHLCMPASAPVSSFPVQEKDGQVFVQVED